MCARDIALELCRKLCSLTKRLNSIFRNKYLCALILPKTWRYTSHLLTYLLTYLKLMVAYYVHSLFLWVDLPQRWSLIDSSTVPRESCPRLDVVHPGGAWSQSNRTSNDVINENCEDICTFSGFFTESILVKITSYLLTWLPRHCVKADI